MFACCGDRSGQFNLAGRIGSDRRADATEVTGVGVR
jgi:hypothetical protein